MQHFGSLNEIKKASVEEISKVIGSKKTAVKIKEMIGDEK